MKIEDVFQIKGRGPVVCVTLDCAEPVAGDIVRRASDGATWTIAGVERMGVLKKGPGDKSGRLLRGAGAPVVGDEVVVERKEPT